MCDHSGAAVRLAAAVCQKQKLAPSWVSVAQQHIKALVINDKEYNRVLWFTQISNQDICERNKKSSRWYAKKSSLQSKASDTAVAVV